MPTTAPESSLRVLRVFLAGHTASTIGTKMQAAALLWHIYQLTGSPVALGALGVFELVPLLLLASLGGIAADRYDRRRILMLTQVVQAVPAVVLGLCTLWDVDSVALIYVAAAAGAAAQGFDTSARKSLVPRLVPASELARAMSWVDLVKNVGKLAGPALMGLVAATAGLGAVYLLNGLTFAVMVGALLMLGDRIGHVDAPETGHPGVWQSFRDGVAYVRGSPVIWSLLWLDFVATFTAAAEALLPIVAEEVLHVGAGGYGVLASAGALGALLAGAGLLTSRDRPRLGGLALGSVATFGAATVLFGLSSSFVACFVALVAVGAADTVSTVVRNTMLQLQSPDALRGRVTAVSMVFSKSGPRLGQLEAGLVAGWLGVSASIVSGGALCMLAAGWMAWRHPWLREASAPSPQ